MRQAWPTGMADRDTVGRDTYEIDLGDLAVAYRLRPMSSGARDRALLSAEGCTGWLLDVGGGAGSHAAVWAADGGQAIVADLSPVMLAHAGHQAGVRLVQAEAQRLPLRGATCGLAYFHLSIHYGSWRRSIDEAFRVVAPGGRIEVWTIAPEAMSRSSLGRWFPKVIEIDRTRFPEPGDIARRCESRGASVAVSTVIEPITRRVGDWKEAVRGRFVSTLQLLDGNEIDEGLAAFSREFPDEESEYRYQMELTRISTVV